MTNSLLRRLVLSVCGLAAVGILGTDLSGYVTGGRSWGTYDVVYFVNPGNKWVSSSSAIAAIQQGADIWSDQTQASVRLVYGGQTSGSSLTLNYKNEVFFRDDANGTIAEAYYWWNGAGNLVDADIVFHEGGFQFFANTGCTNGIYIEDVAVHEFGHVLGLRHSEDPTATMYAAMPSMCDRSQLVLEQDDIDGLHSLYPPNRLAAPPSAPALQSVLASATQPTSSLVLAWGDVASETGYRVERSTDGATFAQVAQVSANVTSWTNSGLASATTYFYRVRAYNDGGTSAYSNVLAGATQAAAQTNTAPGVSIGNPLNDSTYPGGSVITFSGTANDSQDGNLTAALQWTSSIDGPIGSGGAFSRTLSAGTHTIRASATDSGGLTGSKQLTMTVSGPSSAPSLNARGYKVKNSQKVDLTWTGSSASQVDVYRNDVRLRTTANDGVDTDSVSGKRAASTYSYKVCNTGTSVCSNEVTVTF